MKCPVASECSHINEAQTSDLIEIKALRAPQGNLVSFCRWCKSTADELKAGRNAIRIIQPCNPSLHQNLHKCCTLHTPSNRCTLTNHTSGFFWICVCWSISWGCNSRTAKTWWNAPACRNSELASIDSSSTSTHQRQTQEELKLVQADLDLSITSTAENSIQTPKESVIELEEFENSQKVGNPVEPDNNLHQEVSGEFLGLSNHLSMLLAESKSFLCPTFLSSIAKDPRIRWYCPLKSFPSFQQFIYNLVYHG